MAKTLTQKVVFKNTTTKILYDLYVNAKKHALITGAPANITAKEGTRYTVYGDYITGKNLQLVKNKLIVQSWRASDWNKTAIDSTFILYLEQKGKDVILHVIHANLPDKQLKSIDKGWHDYYWKPWKQYLAGKPIMHPEM